MAATWVDHQVSHDAIVACDNAMCSALAAAGFPGRHLKHISPGTPYPSHAQVVVVTPLVERQFGVKRKCSEAPPVLARIGSGSTAIVIRVVAAQGTAAYKAQLKANQRQLRTGGAGLLSSRQVTASPMARRLLLAGRVDARLIVVLTAVAAVHPDRHRELQRLRRGVSPGVSFRTAELAPNDPAAGMSGTDYLKFLLTALDAEPSIYHPLTAGIADGPAGQQTFRSRSPRPAR